MTDEEMATVLGAVARLETLADAAADSFAMGAPIPLRVLDDAREALDDIRALVPVELRGHSHRQGGRWAS